MRRILGSLCHVAILYTAFRWSHSTSGFLTTGVCLSMLLDRYVLRLLPWPSQVARGRELCIGAICMVIGTVAFYFARPGIIPWWEAAYRGMLTSLIVLLIESFVGLVCGWGQHNKSQHVRRRPWFVGLGLRSVLLGVLAFLLPLLATLHPLHTVPKRSPAAFGLAFEDLRFRTTDGLELAGWLVPHAQARGNVIFCHGLGRNRGHVAFFLETLHDLRLNVLTFDFRGHGDSEGHTITFGHREINDILAARAVLGQRFPGKPLIIMGISFGADVSLQALHCLPDVQGFWCESAFSRWHNVVEHNLRWIPCCLREPMEWMYDRLGWIDCGFWGPGVNPIDSLKAVTVPICFCHGEQDELIPFSESLALYDSYAGPKSHHWVESASHYNVRQGCREEYLQRLRTFFTSCLAE